MPKRTPHDEYEYDQHLRAQEDIKTEVIVELREQNRLLIENQRTLLHNLIEATTALNVYRGNLLTATERACRERQSSPCASDCDRHTWDTVKGWQRR